MEACADAQGFVAAVAGEATLIEKARRQAETVLGAFFKAMEWNVTVRWAD